MELTLSLPVGILVSLTSFPSHLSFPKFHSQNNLPQNFSSLCPSQFISVFHHKELNELCLQIYFFIAMYLNCILEADDHKTATIPIHLWLAESTSRFFCTVLFRSHSLYGTVRTLFLLHCIHSEFCIIFSQTYRQNPQIMTIISLAITAITHDGHKASHQMTGYVSTTLLRLSRECAGCSENMSH